MTDLAMPARAARPRRDKRALAILATVLAVAALGYVFQHLPGYGVDAGRLPESPAESARDGGADQLAARIGERVDVEVPVPAEAQIDPALPDAASIRSHLKEAGAMISARRYDDAIRRLDGARDQLKSVPQAYVVLGRALEGKRDYAAARDFYNAALARDPALSDAYWGYATSSEALGDLPSALGAMRSYLHTEPDADPFRRRIAQARSAIWEWESKLGRGAWGSTKGVPPGFTAAELRRDGKGVGVKMPLGDPENSGSMRQYEIKSADPIPIYQR